MTCGDGLSRYYVEPQVHSLHIRKGDCQGLNMGHVQKSTLQMQMEENIL